MPGERNFTNQVPWENMEHNDHIRLSKLRFSPTEGSVGCTVSRTAMSRKKNGCWSERGGPPTSLPAVQEMPAKAALAGG